MKRLVRLVLLACLLVALPLRGYAGVAMSLCEGHHGGAAAAEHVEHAHDHGDDPRHEALAGEAGNPGHAASVCSVCASCSLGAGLAVTSHFSLAVAPPGTLRIPFVVRQVSGFVPEHLERPPLAL